jgi:HemY protein
MAELEEAEHGAAGRVREWLARATRAPRDAAWVADGLVSDRWMPVSPITGRLDAFVWTVPPATLGSQAPAIDEVLADLDDVPKLIEAKAEPVTTVTPEVVAAPAPTPAPKVEPAPEPVIAVPEEPRSEPKPEAKPAPVVEAAVDRSPVGEAKPVEAKAADTKPVETKPADQIPIAKEPAKTSPKPVIFPVSHAPDDPGPEDEPPPEPKKSGFRLFS